MESRRSVAKLRWMQWSAYILLPPVQCPVSNAMQCKCSAIMIRPYPPLACPVSLFPVPQFSLVGQCSTLLVEDGLLLWTCGIGSPESWSSADPWSPFWLSVLISSKQGMVVSQWVGSSSRSPILAPRSSGPHSSELRIVESQWAGRKQTGGPALPDDTEVIQNILSALYRHFFKSQ